MSGLFKAGSAAMRNDDPNSQEILRLKANA
jgi:hypothetical protein